MSISSNYVSFRHTTSVHNKISVAQEILGISKIKSEEFGQYCNLLANIKVTDEDVIQFIGENLLTSDEIQRLKDTGHTIKDIAYRSVDPPWRMNLILSSTGSITKLFNNKTSIFNKFSYTNISTIIKNILHSSFINTAASSHFMLMIKESIK